MRFYGASKKISYTAAFFAVLFLSIVIIGGIFFAHSIIGASIQVVADTLIYTNPCPTGWTEYARDKSISPANGSFWFCEKFTTIDTQVVPSQNVIDELRIVSGPGDTCPSGYVSFGYKGESNLQWCKRFISLSSPGTYTVVDLIKVLAGAGKCNALGDDWIGFGYDGRSGLDFCEHHTSFTISTPVPIPTAPTGLSASCPSPGTTASLHWDKVSGATYYDWRAGDTINSWTANADCTGLQPGDQCVNNYAFPDTAFTSTPGDTYSWWVTACNDAGCSVAATGAPFTCVALAAPACIYTYSDWGACQSNGTQTRTVLSASPSGCTGTPVTSQSCIYTAPSCTYTYSDWGACQSNGTQTRTVLSSSPSGCTGTPVTSQSCTFGSAMTVSLSANPSSGYAPLGVSYTATVSNSGGGSLWYDLDCTNNGTYDVSWGASAETSHTFSNACIFRSSGTYTTRVHVTKLSTSEFAENTATISVSALPPPPPPTVSISANPTSITSGQSSTLSWTSTNTNADSCSINRGIGAVGTSGSRPVSPTTTTTYTLTCTAAGGTASDSATVSVSGVLTLSASLSASPSSGSAPLNATLSASVSGTAAGTINYTFYCNRSDSGTNITSPWDAKFDGVTATSQSTSCTYSSAGTYTAKVIAERDGAPAAQAQQTITVTRGTGVNLTAAPQCNPTSVALSWSYYGVGLLDYVVRCQGTASSCGAPNGGGGGSSWSTIATPLTGSYTDSSVSNNTTYTYAVGNGNSGAWSNIVQATPSCGLSCTPSTGPWSACSASCGGGTQTRNATSSDCTATIESQSCNTQACPPGTPTAAITANGATGSITISSGQSATIAWTSTNADSCSVSPTGWTGTSGSTSTGALTSSKTYTESCTGAGGSASSSVTVNVSGVASSTLSASLSASPSSGSAPLNATLSASVSGTATGTINYTFYCNRSDSGTNVTSPWDQKFDGATANPQTASCSYPSAGTYTAKVIVERDGAPAAQAQQTITVTGGSASPVLSGSAACSANNLSWTSTVSPDDYFLGKCTGSSCAPSSFSTTNVRGTSYTDTAVTNGTAYSYGVQCRTCGPGGNPGDWSNMVTLTPSCVRVNPPTASLSANPTLITSGQSSTLSWTSTNADSCSINRGIGAVGTSGSRPVSPAATATYTLTCTGAGGTASNSATVSVSGGGGTLPTATITANGSTGSTTISPGQSATIAWSSTDATSCSVSPTGWTGTSGIQSTGALTSSQTYSLSCTGAGGSASASVTVNVSAPPPSVSILANGNSGTIYLSQPANYLITWNATNADSCTASGAWSGAKALSGSQTFSNVSAGIYTYGIFCTGAGGSAYNSVGVNVSTVREIAP